MAKQKIDKNVPISGGPKRQTPEEVIAEARKRAEAFNKKSRDLGALHGQKLIAEQRPGFHRRWIRDDEKGRIDKVLSMGYYFVRRNQNGSEIPTMALSEAHSVAIGGSKPNGEPLKQYLMEIPIDMYQERQAKKHERTNSQIREVQKATHGGGLGQTGAAYDPTRGGSNNFDID